EIAIKKIVARSAQQELGQASEVVFKRLLVESDSGQSQKVVLVIVQVPGDRLPIEAAARIAHFVIQIATRFDLKARQQGHNFAVGFHRLRSDAVTRTILRKKIKERRVAQILFEVGALAQV